MAATTSNGSSTAACSHMAQCFKQGAVINVRLKHGCPSSHLNDSINDSIMTFRHKDINANWSWFIQCTRAIIQCSSLSMIKRNIISANPSMPGCAVLRAKWAACNGCKHLHHFILVPMPRDARFLPFEVTLYKITLQKKYVSNRSQCQSFLTVPRLGVHATVKILTSENVTYTIY